MGVSVCVNLTFAPTFAFGVVMLWAMMMLLKLLSLTMAPVLLVLQKGGRTFTPRSSHD
jgi:hypothetical protein